MKKLTNETLNKTEAEIPYLDPEDGWEPPICKIPTDDEDIEEDESEETEINGYGDTIYCC